MPKISVILPIYNVEKYIKKCLDTVVNQTYSNIEIILVNDGSTDSSGQIADSYAEKDKRIKVIHKVNGGASDARNAGLDVATGEYIAFIDPDDYVSYDYFEVLINSAIETDADIVSVRLVRVSEDESPPSMPKDVKIKLFDRKSVLDDVYKKRQKSFFDTSNANKLFKRKIWCELRFPVGLIHHDITVSRKFYYIAEKFAHVTGVSYYYVKRKGSATEALNTKSFFNKFIVFEENIKFFEEASERKYALIFREHMVEQSLAAIGYFYYTQEKSLISSARSFIKKYGGLRIFFRLRIKWKIAYMMYKINIKLYAHIARFRPEKRTRSS